MPRRVVIARVFEGLAQREAKMSCGGGPQFLVPQLLLHGRDFFGRKAEGFKVGEAPVRLTKIRPQRDGRPVGGDGLLLVAHGLQHVRQTKQRIVVGRVKLYRLAIGLKALLLEAPLCQGVG